MKDISKRLVEVSEIINYFDKDSYSKLPDELILAINQNKDSSYEWHYNSSKKLYEQNIPYDTICILSYINMHYLLNIEQVNYFKNLHQQNSTNAELDKIKKHDPSKIFEDNIKKEEVNSIDNKADIIGNNNDMQLVVKKNSIFTKINEFIHNFFKRK